MRYKINYVVSCNFFLFCTLILVLVKYRSFRSRNNFITTTKILLHLLGIQFGEFPYFTKIFFLLFVVSGKFCLSVKTNKMSLEKFVRCTCLWLKKISNYFEIFDGLEVLQYGTYGNLRYRALRS